MKQAGHGVALACAFEPIAVFHIDVDANGSRNRSRHESTRSATLVLQAALIINETAALAIMPCYRYR